MPVVDASKRLPVFGQTRDRSFRPSEVRARPRPAYAVWEFTLKCDQRCVACGPRAGTRRPEELTIEESLALVEASAELGVGEITFIGGEAYLRSDLPTVITRTRELGVRATMTTGGRGLTRATRRAWPTAPRGGWSKSTLVSVASGRATPSPSLGDRGRRNEPIWHLGLDEPASDR